MFARRSPRLSRPLALAAAAALTLGIGLAGPAVAGSPSPTPSPAAMVKQTVGLTDITVEYSSPAVKKRKIWGALVPFDKAWRTFVLPNLKQRFEKGPVDWAKGEPAPPLGSGMRVELVPR